MRYRINHAGNRIVDATPKETHALRPSIAAALRRWHCPDGDIYDFCQEVEVITWTAITEGRVMGDRMARPVDALLGFMFQLAWNLWRNHSRLHATRYEVLHDEVPDIESAHPDARIEARDVLRRIAMHEDIARILFAVFDGPYPERRVGLSRAVFWIRRKRAVTWARDVVSGRYREPDPPTPKHRKGKR